jgi:hypothetical protein
MWTGAAVVLLAVGIWFVRHPEPPLPSQAPAQKSATQPTVNPIESAFIPKPPPRGPEVIAPRQPQSPIVVTRPAPSPVAIKPSVPLVKTNRLVAPHRMMLSPAPQQFPLLVQWPGRPIFTAPNLSPGGAIAAPLAWRAPLAGRNLPSLTSHELMKPSRRTDRRTPTLY